MNHIGHWMRAGLSLVGVAGIFACATPGVKIRNVGQSLASAKRIIIGQLPVGLSHQSANGRELTSKWFVYSKTGLFHPAEEDRPDATTERSYVKVVILGASRPFEVDVTVYRELRRGGKTISGPHFDVRLSEVLAQKFRDSLAHRRDDRNVIDDFRAF